MNLILIILILFLKLDDITLTISNLNVGSYKLLGVNFDEHMSFDNHTTNLCNKLNRSLFCINKAKNFLTAKAVRILYSALIHSRLTYCPIITIIILCANNNNIISCTPLPKEWNKLNNIKLQQSKTKLNQLLQNF